LGEGWAVLEGFPVGFCEDAHGLVFGVGIEACGSIYIFNVQLSSMFTLETTNVAGWVDGKSGEGRRFRRQNDFHSLRNQDLTSIPPTTRFALSLAVKHGMMARREPMCALLCCHTRMRGVIVDDYSSVQWLTHQLHGATSTALTATAHYMSTLL
jgi:hypothetical protein